jgi:cyclopropane-fatty-acyl-phospholipid synthase
MARGRHRAGWIVIGVARQVLSAFDEARANTFITETLAAAGVVVGGHDPWDIRINDPRVYRRVLRDGTLGVGESFVDGWWDCDALDQMIDKVVRADVPDVLSRSWIMAAHVVRARLFNAQASRPFEVGERHYDVGDDLYEAMLGRRMVYTCGYWVGADNLDDAQEAKLDLVCRKIGLRAGMRVLDLGCGWGGFASFAAERYGASVVGYTVSREQANWAKAKYAHLPIEIHLDDYRRATGRYDAVVSIGLMEHVGPKNHRAYMQQAANCLLPGGVVFIHTIGGSHPRSEIDPWFEKYIFPNAAIPSLGQLASAMSGILVPEDVHNIGPHYDRTLMAWWQNFDAAWPRLRDKYGDRFHRAWKFYLLVSAAYFRSRRHSLYQIVATPIGAPQPGTARAS